jgi:hypothetical protein
MRELPPCLSFSEIFPLTPLVAAGGTCKNATREPTAPACIDRHRPTRTHNHRNRTTAKEQASDACRRRASMLARSCIKCCLGRARKDRQQCVVVGDRACTRVRTCTSGNKQSSIDVLILAAGSFRSTRRVVGGCL